MVFSFFFWSKLKLAAKRYANYWEQRVKVFGREKAFQPLTLDGPLKDDDVALKIGFLNWTGAYDPSGRAVMFGDPSKQDKSKYEPESMCRALWYILHAALKSPDTQKKGVVVIVWPHHVKFGQVIIKKICAVSSSFLNSHLKKKREYMQLTFILFLSSLTLSSLIVSY